MFDSANVHLKGIGASKGYAIGTISVRKHPDFDVNDYVTESPEREKEKFEKAISVSVRQLIQLKKRTEIEIGSEEAEIFESHKMILEDPEFSSPVIEKIENDKMGAYKAVEEVIDMFSGLFRAMDNEYMRERAADFEDVGARIKRRLMGIEEDAAQEMADNTIVVAHDLTPSDTATLDKSKVIAFLTDVGGFTSHSSIMARSLGIPAVVGMGKISELAKDNMAVIVDGVEGKVIMNPSEELITSYKVKKADYDVGKDKMKALAKEKAVTASGREITVAANIGSVSDVDDALANGAEAIGLFRTEFLFMESDTMPSEDAKFEAYKTVVEKMAGKSVLIRTLDIGGDKELPYLKQEKEDNPFLGLRAVRLCLKEHELFKMQLRAILRASAFGKIQIMFPMIGAVSELMEAKKMLDECKQELRSKGIDFDEDIEVGMMIEIPAAAVAADSFAKHVDFFSIGTNDLIQYTLAIDRMNPAVSYLYDPMHESVLKLIKMTIDAAHANGIWCGMCGEMAADPQAIPFLVEMGIDELSMSAASIPEAKGIIRRLS